ncbi:tagaturonate reductase [Collinsella tanakaei]|uniref:tagaturonate reductase n=1 Tax=Collinsella tanakaei TaxID=626935 RepID=UPI0019573B35|nr:tagaturonate reductase [Collinsella tanakaei]MBM6754935.1 tagaturonate reductase [Collinsella tanakaei]
MKTLSYDTLAEIGYTGYLLPADAPEKVLQFGEGNFLRAFVDRYFDMANEATGWNGKVVLVQPIDGSYAFADGLNAQDGLYTVYLRGKEDGTTVDATRVISSASRCLNPFRPADYAAIMEVAVSDDLEIIVSNTTEAGIAYDPTCKADDEPPASFPAKLAQVLHARWAAGKPGVIILSCELIDNNGAELLRIVKQHVADWGWEPEFAAWFEDDCTFCTTLVDTIVPGRIRDAEEVARVEERLGYADPFLTVREPFQMWGIQGDEALAEKLPFIQAKLPGVFVTPDVTPYKKRKVRILNGAHTGFVPGAWLAGFNIVRDCMHDDTVRGFMCAMLEEEVIPTLSAELDHDDLEAFAAAVQDRFDNPFIDHALLSICLNSTSKWRARDLPTLVDYVDAKGELPRCLTCSLAALIAFYTTGFEGRDEQGLHLRRAGGTAYDAQDDAYVLDFYAEHAADADADLVHAVLTNEQMWGRDLSAIYGLEAAVAADLATIREQGCSAAFASCLK